MKEPVRFSQALFDLICDHLAEGMPLRAVCRLPNMPTDSAVIKWLVNPELSQQYTQAREIGYQLMADDILLISDTSVVGDEGDNVARSRLQVDSRKWLLSKALPKIYGDKTSIEAKVTHDWAAMCIEAVKPDGE